MPVVKSATTFKTENSGYKMFYLDFKCSDQDKQVIVHRTSESEDLGLHLLDSHPAYITSVDPGRFFFV